MTMQASFDFKASRQNYAIANRKLISEGKLKRQCRAVWEKLCVFCKKKLSCRDLAAFDFKA